MSYLSKRLLTLTKESQGWKLITLPIIDIWQSVIYANGAFIAAANYRVAAYSNDGITWIQTTLPESNYNYAFNTWSITYGEGRFVAIASNAAAYSVDGINWIPITISGFSLKSRSVTYGGGRFVAVWAGGNTSAYSEDGITWTVVTNKLPASNADWVSVTYGQGRFVAVARDSDAAAYSDDGINWTNAILPSRSYWKSVTYVGGRFFAVVEDGSSAYAKVSAYSYDGVNWINYTMPIYCTAITYGAGGFLAVGGNRESAYSDDGLVTWSYEILPKPQGVSGENWHSVAYGAGRFVAIYQDLYNRNVAALLYK